MQAKIGSRDRKQQAVSTVKHTAVAGNQITEVLGANHTFNQRFGQITDLPER